MTDATLATVYGSNFDIVFRKHLSRMSKLHTTSTRAAWPAAILSACTGRGFGRFLSPPQSHTHRDPDVPLLHLVPVLIGC